MLRFSDAVADFTVCWHYSPGSSVYRAMGTSARRLLLPVFVCVPSIFEILHLFVSKTVYIMFREN